MSPEKLMEGLGWLSELSFPPSTDMATPAGRAFLGRLSTSLAELRVTDEEWVAICREANRRGGNHPTSGELARMVGELRVEAAKEARESDWRGQRAITFDPSAVNASAGWSNGRSLRRDYGATLDLVRRGHPGQSSGEGYMAAILREEGERREAESSGERWAPPRYGPDLSAGRSPLERLVGAGGGQ